jgi:trypsin
MTSSEPAVGSFSVVSGWGVLYIGDITPSSQLEAVEVDIISRAACNDAYADYSEVTGNMICAALSGGDKNFCSGDYGGPLVVGDQLVGIVSWGIGCALSYFPAVYSNVATLKSFVTEQTGVQ